MRINLQSNILSNEAIMMDNEAMSGLLPDYLECKLVNNYRYQVIKLEPLSL